MQAIQFVLSTTLLIVSRIGQPFYGTLERLTRGLFLVPAVVIIITMDKHEVKTSITESLRQAIVESGLSYNALEQQTGVKRASIMRFVLCKQSLRLDMADRLAAYFRLTVRKG